MTTTYTWDEARRLANGWGFSLTRRTPGEYRLAPLDGSPAEKEDQAYYTGEIDDAVMTAHAAYQNRIRVPAELIVPIINMNGTAARDLVSQCIKAMDALDLAHAALAEAAPHGRDYPGDSQLWKRAVDQNMAWRVAIQRIARDVGLLAEKIAERS
jgi:hypothetical protein